MHFSSSRLAPWEERKKPEEQLPAIFKSVNARLADLPEAKAFLFPPPAIPGVGTSGGVSFVLEDRAGRDIEFLADNTAEIHGGSQETSRNFASRYDVYSRRASSICEGGS